MLKNISYIPYSCKISIGSCICSRERPGDLPQVMEFYVFLGVEGSGTNENKQKNLSLVEDLLGFPNNTYKYLFLP